MIGWRGEPGKPDAPQHKKMGKITIPLLETLQIPYWIVENDINTIEKKVKEATNHFNSNKRPYAFIIRKNLFEKYDSKKKEEVFNESMLIREDAIKTIMEYTSDDDIIVSSTGFVSRELYEYRESRKKDHFRSFYNIGAMGCASSIGLSIALQKPNKRIIIFDGDGAAIMQMGAFTTIGKYNPKNYIHIVFDNNAHESTGGQPTNSDTIDFDKVAVACNYHLAKVIDKKSDLIKTFQNFNKYVGPILIVINTHKGTRHDIKRPEKSLYDLKKDLISYFSI